MADRTLAILDVGHGNSTVITCADTVAVIDTGPKSGLLEYLRQQDIEDIDLVLISHADQDHIAGLVALLSCQAFRVHCVRVNTDSLKGSDIWDDLLFELDRLNSAGELNFEPCLTTNNSFVFDQGVICLDILGPSTYLAGKGPGSTDRQGRKLRSNSLSAVVRVLVDGVPIALLPGDLDRIGLDDLIYHGQDANARILVFPHHGGTAGSTGADEEFSHMLSEVISPDIVVFSIGRHRRPEKPKPEIILAVRKCLPDVRMFCTELSRHCAVSVPEICAQHLNAVYCRGREHNECCAGSIIVDLDSPNNILPPYDEVQAFISTVAPEALCRRILEPVSSGEGFSTDYTPA
jgi:beta-lactamase superfamily II metal-dependent hydrolase